MNNKDIYMSLKNIGCILYNFYTKLFLLELNHKENSKEYNDIIKAIEFYKKIEDEICNIVARTKNRELMLELLAKATMEMCGTTEPKKLIHDPSYILGNKIYPKDLVSMRISAHMQDIFVHLKLENDTKRTSDIYDAFIPQKNKYFIELLTDQSKDPTFINYRKILLEAKYDFAFVNYKESLTLKDKDEKVIEAATYEDFKDLIEYAKKYSNLNKASFLHPKNIRRFLLEINYIRANLIQMRDDYIVLLERLFDPSILYDEDNLLSNEGLDTFYNILSFAEEDKDKYGNEGFSFKRKF